MVLAKLMIFCLFGCLLFLIVYFIRSFFKQSVSLNDQVVLITGSSGGLGKQLALKFFNEGCKVIMTGRSEAQLEKARQSILLETNDRQSSNLIVQEFDISAVTDLHKTTRQIIDRIENCFGSDHLDILVNNAGVSQRSDFMDTLLESHRHIFDVNYFGPIELCRLLLPNLLKSNHPLILNICSVQSWISVPGRCSYSASKFALRAFGDSLRRELGHRLKIISIYPGYINTNIDSNALGNDGLPVKSISTVRGLQVGNVANKIMNCIVSGSKTTDLMIYSDFFQRIAVFLGYFCPSLLNWYLLRMHTNKKDN